MSQNAIEIKDLSKVYHIAHERAGMKGTATFRDALYGVAKKPVRLITGRKLKKEDFWALKDIDFEVGRGDVVGIIGRNGSGKSTLLKILSQIVEPTKGEVRLRGRVASLLEVGTGFHPELTGRENIFFNGAILGMRRKEILSKFDEIVNFSEVEKFLDTPVKFYSSGMYVRLAFAVAAHLDPDILIVDEVLAVGDAEFQKKSLSKMKDVTSTQQRTVLFVSHNMEAIRSICNNTIWINQGKLMAFGNTEDVINRYTSSAQDLATQTLSKRQDRQGSGRLKFEDVEVVVPSPFDRTIKVVVSLKKQTDEVLKNIKLSLDVYGQAGEHISNLTNTTVGKRLDIDRHNQKIVIKLENINLVPGQYRLGLFSASDNYNSEIFDWIESATTFNIPEYDYYSTGSPPGLKGKYIFMDFKYD